MRTVTAALIGVGSVGRNVLRILEMKAERLREQYGLVFRIVLAADSSGMAFDPGGFDLTALRLHKEARGRLSELPQALPGGSSPAEVLGTLEYDLLLEASPVNLTSGEPGLGAVRAALARGKDAVLANKAPLVLAWRELNELAQRTGSGLAYSATVCGALPVVNIGRRDLIAADVSLLRGIFNSTSNFILDEMEHGRDYGDALAEAQRRGLAETDPSLDVDGWDTANKLVILANSVLGVPTTLADVTVTGIRAVTAAQMAAERAQGRAIRLVATAQRNEGSYTLSVAPVALPADDFLATCSGWEMGVEFHSDLYGRMYHKIWEREPLPTAAAMLRDAVNLYAGGSHG